MLCEHVGEIVAIAEDLFRVLRYTLMHLALAIIVRLSARVQSTAAAQQAASLISLPIIMASYVASSGFVLNPTMAAAIVGSVAWVLAIWGIASGARAINRERLLGVGSGS